MSITKILLPIVIVMAIILTLNVTGVVDLAKTAPPPVTPPPVQPPSSPSTGKIAFVSDRDGDEQIYVMNADGSNQTRLTYNSAGGSSPAWSPK